MKRYLLSAIIAISLFFIAGTSIAQLTVTTQTNPLTLAKKIIGSGVTITNAQFKGSAISAGTFTAVHGSFPIDSGIVLTTGRAKSIAGSPGVDGFGSAFASSAGGATGGAGDADLTSYSGQSTKDACILEFDFVPQGDSINVKYIFGSEEYPEFNCTQFNDVFAFLISGPGFFTKKNIALVPNAINNTPVTINSINNGIPGSSGGDIANCWALGPGSPYTQYFVDNQTGIVITYDGHTVVLTAKAKVTPCQTYHIKLAIADAIDDAYDSGVFIEAGSFSSKRDFTTESSGPVVDTSSNVVMIEGCKDAQVKIKRAPNVVGPFNVNVTYGGTATPGTDFTTLPSLISFTATDTMKTFTVSALADGIIEGTEKAVIYLSKNVCTTQLSDSVILYIKDSLINHSKVDTSFCTATPLTIKSRDTVANLINTYLWNTGSTSQAINVTQPGTYSVVHTFGNGCFNIDTFNIATNDPSLILTPANAAICPGDNVTLSVTSNADTLTWSNGLHTNAITINNAGQYWIMAKNKRGCIKSDTAFITAKPNPLLNLGADTSICEGNNILLNAFYTGATYSWSTGDNSSSITVFAAGKYSVVSTLNGCSAKDTITIAVNQLPAVHLGSDTSICLGKTIQLNAFYPGATHLWNNGDTASVITVTNAGNYSVVNNNKGCIATGSIIISTKPIPSVNLGADTSICQDKTIQLNALYAGATYSWNTGATSSSINVSTAGNYSVVNTLNGCTATDSINIAITPLPVVNLGGDTTICEFSTLPLNAFYAGATHLWNNGDTTSSIVISSAGMYNVINTLKGCTATDTINITTRSAPFLNLGNDTSMCNYDSLRLNAFYAGATYLWNTGAVTPSIMAKTAGKYSVVSTFNFCAAIDSINISYKKMPVVNAGNDIIISQNSTAQLNATVSSNNASYLWSPPGTLNNASIPNPIASPTAATEYTLHVTSVDGCFAEDKVIVKITFPLAIPNAFSPNGDNINDKWTITNLEFYPKSKVYVYNRYGQPVFVSSGYNNPWDGTNKGKPLAPATYYYVIDTGDGHTVTGWVMLLR